MNRRRVVLALAAIVIAPSTNAGCEEKRSEPTATSASAAAPATSPGVTTPSSTPSAAAPVSASAPRVAPDAIAAQHVLVTFKGAKGADKSITRSKADAQKRAEEVVAKAKTADFSALVSEYSDDPGSKARMGSVGKFTREKMTKPFSDAAFALGIDEISGVVESDFGFHVIKRNQ